MFDPPKDDAEKAERLHAVLRDVEKNRNHWRQDIWHCGTSHCFAGFAELRAMELQPTDSYGKILKKHRTNTDTFPGWSSTGNNAARWLGLTGSERNLLFEANNTLPALRNAVRQLAPLTLPPEPPKRKVGVREGCYALAASLLLALLIL